MLPQIVTAQELKSLQTRLAKAQTRQEVLKSEVSTAQRNYQQCTNEITSILYRISEIRKEAENEPMISEHAILRYLERVEGVNIDNIVNTILTDDIKDKIKFMCNGKIKCNAYTLVIKNCVIVSVETKA
jgi:sugar-specific transcriptional regulator TrmB